MVLSYLLAWAKTLLAAPGAITAVICLGRSLPGDSGGGGVGW